jgi:uncharacterized protein YbcI
MKKAIGSNPLENSTSTMKQQIAGAVGAFQQQSTGHKPKAINVAMSHDTVAVTLHDALSPAEIRLAKSPSGAAQMQDYHRRLFASSCGTLLQEIKRITGLDVREATAELETATGAVMQVFATGTVVYVFLLSGRVPAEHDGGNASNDHS